jgi:hypothetical protein
MSSIKITIGRDDDNTLQVQEEFTKVSRHHGQIDVAENGEISFTDFSSGGTTINGEFIKNRTVTINRGDVIILGGECTLNWDMLDNYLPKIIEVGKKTVYKNFEPNIPDNHDTNGRKTKLIGFEDDDGKKTELKGYATTGEPYKKTVPIQNIRTIGTSSGGYGKKKTYTADEISKYLRKWNWGAFFLSYIWGCFHRIYWPLLILAANLIVTPLPWLIKGEELIIAVGIITWIVHLALAVVAVYLGLNGSEQAWRKKVCDRNLDLFKKKEQRWATAGFVCFGIGFLSAAVTIIILIF